MTAPMLATLVLLAIPASSQVPAAAPVKLVDKPVVVGVFNALDGAPVANASVALADCKLTAATDGTGHARFEQVPDTRVLRLWTSPKGFTCGAQEITRGTSAVEWTSMFVMPEDMYTTGLIPHAKGGTYTFEGTIDGALGRNPFWFRITVPPDALGQDFSLGISPRPTFAESSNGLSGWALTLGQWHATIRNAAGEILSKPLDLPVQFEFKPWTLSSIPLESPEGKSAYRLYSYDVETSRFEELPNPVTPNASDGTVSIATKVFTFFTARKEEGEGLPTPGDTGRGKKK